MSDCFTPSFLPYSAKTESIDFSGCFPGDLTRYGLTNAVVDVTSNVDPARVVLQFNTITDTNRDVILSVFPELGSVILLTVMGIPLTSNAHYSAVQRVLTLSTLYSNPGQTPGRVGIIGNQATVSFFATPEPNLPDLPPLLFIFNFNPDIIIPDAVTGNLSFSVFEPGSVPNVTATAYASPDKQQICQLDFTITLDENCAVVTHSYKQYHNNQHVDCYGAIIDIHNECRLSYCPNFASVMCCANNCTLRQALNCLNLDDEQSFLQYMVLRYILSGLIFGCFSVKYLRQKYNQQFLKALRTPEYEAFLPVLGANPVYTTFFIC